MFLAPIYWCWQHK